MAHYAKVVDGIVTKVIIAEPEFFDTFIDSSPGEWIQTSYNTRGGVHYKPNSMNEPSEDQSKSLRKNYAGVGYSYNKTLDAFIPPKPYNSWVLDNDTGTWKAPVTRPNDNNVYLWNEAGQSWEQMTELDEHGQIL